MAQLKFDSELFVQSVLANPENQMLIQQPQQQQQHQQQEDGFCDSRLSQTLGDMFSDPNIFPYLNSKQIKYLKNLPTFLLL